jgi:hypothetical protein
MVPFVLHLFSITNCEQPVSTNLLGHKTVTAFIYWFLECDIFVPASASCFKVSHCDSLPAPLRKENLKLIFSILEVTVTCIA